MDTKKLLLAVIASILVGLTVQSVLALDFVPAGNINGKNFYSIYGFPFINASNFCLGSVCISDWSVLNNTYTSGGGIDVTGSILTVNAGTCLTQAANGLSLEANCTTLNNLYNFTSGLNDVNATAVAALALAGQANFSAKTANDTANNAYLIANRAEDSANRTNYSLGVTNNTANGAYLIAGRADNTANLSNATANTNTGNIVSLNLTKMNASDQRYNDSLLIISLNDSKLNTSDQRYNETVLVFSLNTSKLNTSDQRYNETLLINATNASVPYRFLVVGNGSSTKLLIVTKNDGTNLTTNWTDEVGAGAFTYSTYFNQDVNTTSNVSFNGINNIIFVNSGDAADLLTKVSRCGINSCFLVLQGIYTLTSPLIFNASNSRVVFANGSSLLAGAGFVGNSVFEINGSFNTFENLNVDADHKANVAIMIRESKNSLMNPTAWDANWSGIEIDSTTGAYYNDIYSPRIGYNGYINGSCGIRFDYTANENKVYGGQIGADMGVCINRSNHQVIQGVSFESGDTNTVNSHGINIYGAESIDNEISMNRFESWKVGIYINDTVGTLNVYGNDYSGILVQNVFFPSNYSYKKLMIVKQEAMFHTINTTDVEDTSRNGLIAYIPLNQNNNVSTDWINPSNDGVNTGFGINNTWTQGFVDYGFNFTQTNFSSIRFPLNVTGLTQLTFMVAVKPSGDQNNGSVISWERGGFGLEIQNTSGNLFYVCRFGNTTGSYSSTSTDSSDFELGNWSIITCMYNGTHILMYHNAGNELSNHKKATAFAASAGVDYVGTTIAPIDGFWVGDGKHNSNRRPYNGLVSDLKIWNRSLTDREVETEYRKLINKKRSLDMGALDRSLGGTVYGNLNDTGTVYATNFILQNGTVLPYLSGTGTADGTGGWVNDSSKTLTLLTVVANKTKFNATASNSNNQSVVLYHNGFEGYLQSASGGLVIGGSASGTAETVYFQSPTARTTLRIYNETSGYYGTIYANGSNLILGTSDGGAVNINNLTANAIQTNSLVWRVNGINASTDADHVESNNGWGVCPNNTLASQGISVGSGCLINTALNDTSTAWYTMRLSPTNGAKSIAFEPWPSYSLYFVRVNSNLNVTQNISALHYYWQNGSELLPGSGTSAPDYGINISNNNVSIHARIDGLNSTTLTNLNNLASNISSVNSSAQAALSFANNNALNISSINSSLKASIDSLNSTLRAVDNNLALNLSAVNTSLANLSLLEANDNASQAASIGTKFGSSNFTGVSPITAAYDGVGGKINISLAIKSDGWLYNEGGSGLAWNVSQADIRYAIVGYVDSVNSSLKASLDSLNLTLRTSDNNLALNISSVNNTAVKNNTGGWNWTNISIISCVNFTGFGSVCSSSNNGNSLVMYSQNGSTRFIMNNSGVTFFG